ELQDARIAGRGDPAEARRAYRASRVGEIHFVEYVEELRAEPHAGAFGDFGVLDQAEVRVEEPRSPQDVPSGVAEVADGVGPEERRVEKSVDHLGVRQPA